MRLKSETKTTAARVGAKSGQLPPEWKAHPFVRGLNPEHLEMLEECAMMTGFNPGQVIFHEGETANRFYLILDGSVAVEMTSTEPAPVGVDHVSGGEVLGWSWLFPPYGLHFTAEAVEPTRAIFFYGTWLRER